MGTKPPAGKQLLAKARGATQKRVQYVNIKCSLRLNYKHVYQSLKIYYGCNQGTFRIEKDLPISLTHQSLRFCNFAHLFTKLSRSRDTQ